MKETCQGPQNSIFKKNLNENNDFDDKLQIFQEENSGKK